MESPRSCFADDSPITHIRASIILDFPHPLGPTIQDIEEGKVTVVGSTKDLKPDSFIEFNLIICILLGGKNPLLQKEALMKQN